LRGGCCSQYSSQRRSDLDLQRRSECRAEFGSQSRRYPHSDPRFGCRVEFGSELRAELAAKCPTQGSDERRNPGSSSATRAAAKATKARVFCGCRSPSACPLYVGVCWPPNTILPGSGRPTDCPGGSICRCSMRHNKAYNWAYFKSNIELNDDTSNCRNNVSNNYLNNQPNSDGFRLRYRSIYSSLFSRRYMCRRK